VRVKRVLKGVAKTKRIAYQDYKNYNCLGKKSGESVKVKI